MLLYEPSSKLEYLSSSTFLRRNDDSNGVHGTWWVRYTKLLDTFVEGDVDKMLEKA